MPPSTAPAPFYRMLYRPYGPAVERAFYWLTRRDSAGVDRVIVRGEGQVVRLRIERFLREIATNRPGDDGRVAAEALRTGWQLRA